jgi:hypothetical protein
MVIFVPFYSPAAAASIICESDSFTNLRHDMLYIMRERKGGGRGRKRE